MSLVSLDLSMKCTMYPKMQMELHSLFELNLKWKEVQDILLTLMQKYRVLYRHLHNFIFPSLSRYCLMEIGV